MGSTRLVRVLAGIALACAMSGAGCSDSTSAHAAKTKPHPRKKLAPPADSGALGDGALPPSDGATPDDDAGLARTGLTAIALENMHPGTAPPDPVQPSQNHELEAYASKISAAPGDAVELAVDVDRDRSVGFSLYRYGYYQGVGTRLIASVAPRPVQPQPACTLDAMTGLVECAWASAFSVTIDESWPSGYYEFVLSDAEGFQTRVPLIVREGSSRAPGLVQASVTTWQAYNTWGGTSLYRNLLPPGSAFTLKAATRVSFDRPFEAQNGLWPFESLVRFVERQGYEVSYVTNVDIDADPSVLDGRRLFMSVAHDEYWSVPERKALDAARDQGVSLAFFSGNSGYWRIRLEPSSRGVERRIVTCYKSRSTDPVRNSDETTTLYRKRPNARPENALIGEMSVDWSGFPGFPYVVKNPDHFIYEGTGVAENDTLSNVIGPEWDRIVDDNGVSPAGLELVADSPTIADNGAPAYAANASIYYPTADSFVFASGTIDWGLGLSDDPGYSDPRIMRITDNVLRRAGLPAAAPPTEVAIAAPELPTLVGSEVLAGSGAQGQDDGPALSATFHGPVGLAAGLAGELYIIDAGNKLVRKLARDGTVSTLAASVGALSVPLGIAVASDGKLYVSDAGANRVRVISADGTAISDFAGSGGVGSDDNADPLRATFSSPRGIAFGPDGALYVADSANAAIRRIAASGVSTLARDQPGVSAVAVGSNGELYFTAYGRAQVGVIDGSGVRVLANAAGQPGNRDGAAGQALLRPMDGLIVEADRLVFADTGGYRVRALSLGNEPRVTTVFGDGRASASPQDSRRAALPRGLVAFRGGYALADCGGNRVVWFRDLP